jgi:hypothetical protein
MNRQTKAALAAAMVYANAWFIFWICGGQLFTADAFLPATLGFFLATITFVGVESFE